MTRLYPGLDFGTTNSTLGLAGAAGTNAGPRLLALEGGAPTLPSALFFSMEDGRTYFGREAIFEYTDGAEGRFMRALKSILGSSLMEETTPVRRERLSFVDIIGRFLEHMRHKLEAEAKRAALAGEGAISLDQVVMGRPVRFVDEDDAADRAAQDQLEEAARAQGFSDIEFQFEPVAAALYYESGIASEELALVVDIGGGTSDFTVVRLSPERARAADRLSDILSSTGVHVGGTDFDRLLSIAEVMPHFGLGSQTADGKRRIPVWYFNDMATWHRINTLYTAQVKRDIAALEKEAAEPRKLVRYAHLLEHRSGHRLASAVETAKIALTDAAETQVTLTEPGLAFQAPATRSAFETATRDLVTKIDGAVGEALRAAGVAADAIETVILTGGGAQVPAVRAAALARFPHARAAQSDAFGSVGLGLGLDAARKFG
ncbi:Hsp70 family protein [Fulvimarina sp. 2208YS6-2-32]|uniref:Hsp70 family protein n=1 Tax=Fulvimarina uroteuthidis TaxID=3098149 RepID=A0ABU5HZS8_9HYPH|nr:Hsp70 family protein [Fulvimarina sp. 2208YS6-2-32]MDY8108372.1 Hsp70 family protein [Fulvimarina sp. 2208YS6-2-32]